MSLEEIIIANPDIVKYIKIIKDMIIEMIKNDFIIGRIDKNREPYSIDIINNFIKINEEKLNYVVDNIIKAYNDDNDLELLENPLYDWIGEFLYEEINTDIELDIHKN